MYMYKATYISLDHILPTIIKIVLFSCSKRFFRVSKGFQGCSRGHQGENKLPGKHIYIYIINVLCHEKLVESSLCCCSTATILTSLGR